MRRTGCEVKHKRQNLRRPKSRPSLGEGWHRAVSLIGLYCGVLLRRAWAANNQMAGSQSNMFEGFGGTISELAIESKTISVFDKSGKPLSPPTGYNFNGELGSMQGITATPNGDVWAVDAGKSQLAYFPKGDSAHAR